MRHPVATYLWELSSVFFKWWWAAITGVATLLGYVSIPEAGFTLSRANALLIILAGMTLGFLCLSMLTASWQWFMQVRMRPRVQRITKDESGSPIFTINADGVAPSTGALLTLHRLLQDDVEVCVAVLDVTNGRADGVFQAEPRWISDAHKADLKLGRVEPTRLLVREVSNDVVRLIEKCVKEPA